MSEIRDRLLTTKDAAAFLGISAKSLERRRLSGGGPNFLKLSDGQSGPVRYAAADIERWLADRRRESTGATGAQALAAS
jgi:hypothetical protein